MNSVVVPVLGAIFNLNHASNVVHWHFIELSVSNVILIGTMFVVFALAIALPFPGAAARRRGGSS